MTLPDIGYKQTFFNLFIEYDIGNGDCIAKQLTLYLELNKNLLKES